MFCLLGFFNFGAVLELIPSRMVDRMYDRSFKDHIKSSCLEKSAAFCVFPSRIFLIKGNVRVYFYKRAEMSDVVFSLIQIKMLFTDGEQLPALFL